MTAFITVEELKSYPLPVTDKQWSLLSGPSAYDQVETILDFASQHVEDYLDRNLSSAYYTETILGNGRPQLIVENYPIQSLSTVNMLDFTGYPTSYDPALFMVDAGAGIVRFIDRNKYTFYPYNYWQITYQAGYNTIPGPIKHAVALQAVEMLQPLFRGGAKFAEVDLITGINSQMVDMLEKYKRKRIG